MYAIRRTVRVLPGGRIEITDPALEPGVEAEVVVLLPEPAGDGAGAAPDAHATDAPPARLKVGPDDLAVPAPRDPNRRVLSLVDIIGLAPSNRTAEEIDRELRELRDEWDRGEVDA